MFFLKIESNVYPPQNIQSLNNPINLVILVQTINKNFTHPASCLNQDFQDFGIFRIRIFLIYMFFLKIESNVYPPQNIQSLNNPVHLAILVILLVQTINKNFTHPFLSVNPPTYCISFNLVIDRFLFSILVEFCQWCVKFLSHLFTGPRKLHFFYIVGRDQSNVRV